MLRSVLALGLAAVALAAPAVTHAQEPYGPPPDTIRVMPRFGIQGNWSDDADFGLGLRYEAGMTWLLPRAGGLRLATSFDYFLDPPADLDLWEINANLINVMAVPNVRAAWYLGGGLNVAHMGSGLGGSETRVGGNLLAGIRLPGTFRPFLEGRLELGGGEMFVLTAGLMLR